MKAIRLQPVGDGIAIEFLDEVAAALARIFEVSCHVLTERMDASRGFDLVRGQYYSTALLREMQELAGGEEDIRTLGVTELDLFVPVLTFVFGEAQLEGRCALISLRRLREEFYGLPPRADLLMERAVKEAVHELGHTFGLRHCADWACVMTSSHAVERLDLKQARFCNACWRLVAVRL